MQVIITHQFDGYPNGEDKPSVEFKPSDKPIEVKDDFGQMIIAKGLARAADAPKEMTTHDVVPPGAAHMPGM